MPGPDPRTRSKPKKREAPESPKDPRLEGEKKDPKFKIVETRPEAPIGALGNKKKAPRTSAAAQQAKEAEDIVRAAVRDKGRDQSLAKGGRAMYKSGMRVCKLAKRGKGRAYGKNS